jgi:hypothetical protein
MNETAARWSVEIFLSEIDGHSHAEARLVSGAKTPLTATGTARLSERDPLDVPEIGYELATARALRSLADKLSRAAAEDVQAIAGS